MAGVIAIWCEVYYNVVACGVCGSRQAVPSRVRAVVLDNCMWQR